MIIYFLSKLALCEGILLGASALCQVIVHIRNPRHANDYVELKNETKDGVTVVLPDGSEFYAKTDHRLQRMYDELYRSREE